MTLIWSRQYFYRVKERLFFRQSSLEENYTGKQSAKYLSIYNFRFIIRFTVIAINFSRCLYWV